MTSETEALCAKVSEFRGEWREDYDAPCGSCGHRKVCHGRNRGCAVWQFDGHTCGCATYQPQPLDWLDWANLGKLLEAVVAFHANDIEYAASRMERWITMGSLPLKEAILMEYCENNEIKVSTPSTEGR